MKRTRHPKPIAMPATAPEATRPGPAHWLIAALLVGLLALVPGHLLRADDTPIYPNMAADLIGQGALVIDVRRAEEVEDTGLLADAKHVEHGDLEGLKEAIGNDTWRTVVVYCASGRRAGIAIDALQEAGFTGLVNAGGYEDLHLALHGPDDSEAAE